MAFEGINQIDIGRQRQQLVISSKVGRSLKFVRKIVSEHARAEQQEGVREME